MPPRGRKAGRKAMGRGLRKGPRGFRRPKPFKGPFKGRPLPPRLGGGGGCCLIPLTGLVAAVFFIGFLINIF